MNKVSWGRQEKLFFQNLWNGSVGKLINMDKVLKQRLGIMIWTTLRWYPSNHNICLLVRTLQQIYVMSVSFCTIDQTSQRFLTTMAQTAIFHPQILSPEFLWAKIIIGPRECLLMTLQFNHLGFFHPIVMSNCFFDIHLICGNDQHWCCSGFETQTFAAEHYFQ